MECIFCKIIDEKIPAKIIYKDDHVIAFEDINPQAPVHVLVIPRKHISTVLEIEDTDKGIPGHLFDVANAIARQKEIEKKGFRLVLNCNEDAGQTVFHLHLHLLGGRIMKWPPG
ncbi:MAG: histidine triad nucleotide-binding protein [Thermodesulfovibrionales bacterium]